MREFRLEGFFSLIEAGGPSLSSLASGCLVALQWDIKQQIGLEVSKRPVGSFSNGSS